MGLSFVDSHSDTRRPETRHPRYTGISPNRVGLRMRLAEWPKRATELFPPGRFGRAAVGGSSTCGRWTHKHGANPERAPGMGSVERLGAVHRRPRGGAHAPR